MFGGGWWIHPHAREGCGRRQRREWVHGPGIGNRCHEDVLDLAHPRRRWPVLVYVHEPAAASTRTTRSYLGRPCRHDPNLHELRYVGTPLRARPITGPAPVTMPREFELAACCAVRCRSSLPWRRWLWSCCWRRARRGARQARRCRPRLDRPCCRHSSSCRASRTSSCSGPSRPCRGAPPGRSGGRSSPHGLDRAGQRSQAGSHWVHGSCTRAACRPSGSRGAP